MTARRDHKDSGKSARAEAGILSDAWNRLKQWILVMLPWLDRGISYGRRSERVAERHLRWRGYRIVARNFRAAGAEIDLIAMDRDTLVFVEVKARKSDSMGTPEAAVDERKQRRIRRAAEIFAARHRALDRAIRFDVIAVRGDGGRDIKHLRNAF